MSKVYHWPHLRLRALQIIFLLLILDVLNLLMTMIGTKELSIRLLLRSSNIVIGEGLLGMRPRVSAPIQLFGIITPEEA